MKLYGGEQQRFYKGEWLSNLEIQEKIDKEYRNNMTALIAFMFFGFIALPFIIAIL